MKRLYREAGCRQLEGAWAIELDGRAVRTPAGGTLRVPTAALALAICGEWNRQGEKVDTAAMPLTRISNAAIDLVPARREQVIDQIVRFGETDLLCYRATEPAGLVARQQAAWQPPLDWLMRQYDAPLKVAHDIGHVPQPEASLAALRAAIAGMSDFQLAAMSNLATVLGSIVLALAVRDRALATEAAWEASIVDEMFQAGQWGDDAEAIDRRAVRKAEFEVAVAMLTLLDRPDG